MLPSFYSKKLIPSGLLLSNKGRILKKRKLCLLSSSSNNFEPSYHSYITEQSKEQAKKYGHVENMKQQGPNYPNDIS